jgi:hypothetical protein
VEYQLLVWLCEQLQAAHLSGAFAIFNPWKSIQSDVLSLTSHQGASRALLQYTMCMYYHTLDTVNGPRQGILWWSTYKHLFWTFLCYKYW